MNTYDRRGRNEAITILKLINEMLKSNIFFHNEEKRAKKAAYLKICAFSSSFDGYH